MDQKDLRRLLIVLSLLIVVPGCPAPPELIKSLEWQPPPANITRDEFFPVELGGYELVVSSDIDSIERFDFEANGWLAIYQADNDSIEIVFVSKMNTERRDELYSSVRDNVVGKRSKLVGGLIDEQTQWLFVDSTGVQTRFFFNTDIVVVVTSNSKDPFEFAKQLLSQDSALRTDQPASPPISSIPTSQPAPGEAGRFLAAEFAGELDGFLVVGL